MRRTKAPPIVGSSRSAWLALADNLATAMVFLSFFVAHWIAQAMAWANASRNAYWHLLFGLLGMPLIHLAGSRTDDYFLLLSVPNSLLWAAALTYLAARFRTRRDRSRRAGKD
ncbi:MAG: hypothetical protein ACREPW_02665 [Candidatus Binataceae bacterium]